MFEQALALAPENADLLSNFAATLLEAGRPDEAMARVQAALRADEKHDGALVNLGAIHAHHGEVRQAERVLRRALKLNPVNAAGHKQLAVLLERTGRPMDAMNHWRDALDFGRFDPDAYYQFGTRLAQAGRFGPATRVLERGLREAPNDPSLLMALATIRATCPLEEHRLGAQAVMLAERLVQLQGPDHVAALGLLAGAYAEAGRFDDAVRSAERAIKLARAAAMSDVATRLEGNLALFRAGRPFHQPLAPGRHPPTPNASRPAPRGE